MSDTPNTTDARRCAKCDKPFSAARPEVMVGDESCGYWKPRFSAHVECITVTGNTSAVAGSPDGARPTTETGALLLRAARLIETVATTHTDDADPICAQVMRRDAKALRELAGRAGVRDESAAGGQL